VYFLELESLSNGRTKFRRPIDEEMQVPLGVFVIVSCFVRKSLT